MLNSFKIVNNCMKVNFLLTVDRAFDIDLLYVAQHFKVPLAEVAVNWREIPGDECSIYKLICLCLLHITSQVLYLILSVLAIDWFVVVYPNVHVGPILVTILRYTKW